MLPSSLPDARPVDRAEPNGNCSENAWHPNQGQRAAYPEPNDPGALHDMICVGFGPASLAIAIALHDALTAPVPSRALGHLREKRPKVAFLERQSQFAWHEGMLLPDAKMQINFIKDLATLRDPRSEFTFLNYLHQKRRLVPFTNLGTFFPLRVEYEDYMRWCAKRFADLVHYGQDVLEIVPEQPREVDGKVETFAVRSLDVATGQVQEWKARHVVIAVGGKPRIPTPFPQGHPRVIHSARYLNAMPRLLEDRDGQYRIAVVGCGQSAAETFNDLHSRYPSSVVTLVIPNGALKPSDDSPFVNEIFDPNKVDGFYQLPEKDRLASIAACKDTNYGVVRLDLLEHIYAKMYEKRLQQTDEQDWTFKILPYRRVKWVEDLPDWDSLRLKLQSTRRIDVEDKQNGNGQTLDVDLVVVATGYDRDGHEQLLRPVRHLMPDGDAPGKAWTVARNYRAHVDARKVSSSAGIWLQGCNENTHGLGDTLLSILAIRGGEVIESIFGEAEPKMNGTKYANGSSNGLSKECLDRR